MRCGDRAALLSGRGVRWRKRWITAGAARSTSGGVQAVSGMRCPAANSYDEVPGGEAVSISMLFLMVIDSSGRRLVGLILVLCLGMTRGPGGGRTRCYSNVVGSVFILAPSSQGIRLLVSEVRRRQSSKCGTWRREAQSRPRLASLHPLTAGGRGPLDL